MQYLQYEFFSSSEDEQQWLIALLSDLPFEGFEETNISVLAFIKADAIDDGEVRLTLDANNLSHVQFAVNVIEQKNWNEEWEKNFPPVIIAERVGIRAPFHEPLNTEIELIIEPKMSFGTGHHSTTASMIELMLGLDLKNKLLLDMGSGTGVLAILANKLGVEVPVAIDHEEWAYQNAIENAQRNNSNIDARLSEAAVAIEEKFDVILANINRHIIVENLHHWMPLLNPNGEVLLSGFIEQDIPIIRELCASFSLEERQLLQKGECIAMKFQRT